MSVAVKKKVAVVTGSARGIGLNIAEMLACGGESDGMQVVICDIDESEAHAQAKRLKEKGCAVQVVAADLSKPGSGKVLVDQVVKRFGRLDVIVHNVRAGEKRELATEDEANWNLTIDVMLKSVFFVSQAGIAEMAKTGGGAIVNISSVAANLSCPLSPSYHVAKAGVEQLSRYLAVHAGQFGVRVNSIVPGFIVRDEDLARYSAENNTNYRQLAEFAHPGGKVGYAKDVANLVAFLVSDRASFISGQSIVLDGALSVQEQSDLLFRWARKAGRTHIDEG